MMPPLRPMSRIRRAIHPRPHRGLRSARRRSPGHQPGAGLCPVRGHSNVQGDRTVGITEKPTPEFLERLERRFGFEPPRAHGHDVVKALEAMLRGEVNVLIALGGNFAAAVPDWQVTRSALRGLDLTVQISTKLNRSHLVHGRESLILPCLGHTEIDIQASGPSR
jgi:anaerobic selenocysteine-containing dehydrogenase